MKRMIGTNTSNWWVSFTRAFAFEIYYNLERFFCVNSPQNQGGLLPKIWFECRNIHIKKIWKGLLSCHEAFWRKQGGSQATLKISLKKQEKIHALERSTWLHLLNIIEIWSFLVFWRCSQDEGSSTGFDLPIDAKGKNTCSFSSVHPGVEQKVKKGTVRLKSGQQPSIF